MVTLNFQLHTGETVSVQAQPGGSVMEAAIAQGVSGIVAECYGAGVCGTCHVLVDRAWQDVMGQPSAWEADMIEQLPLAQSASRLSCQIIVAAELNGAIFHVPEHQGASA